MTGARGDEVKHLEGETDDEVPPLDLTHLEQPRHESHREPEARQLSLHELSGELKRSDNRHPSSAHSATR
jgi:hypothetical protein